MAEATAPAMLQVADVAPIDLQDIEAELLEIGERSGARPEVIETDFAADLPERLQVAIGDAEILDGRALGEFEQEPTARRRMLADQAYRAGHIGLAHDASAGHVDRKDK